MPFPLILAISFLQGLGPPDVPPGDPTNALLPKDSYTAARWLAERRIVDLTAEGNFEGAKPISREALAVWVYNATDGRIGVRPSELTDSWLPDMTSRTLPKDIKRVKLAESSFAAACLNFAKFAPESNLSRLQVYNDGLFRPARLASRYEVALGIYLALGADGISVLSNEVKEGKRTPEAKPADLSQTGLIQSSAIAIDKAAYESVGFLCDVGVLHRYEDGLFRGPRPASRYEAATMIYRWVRFELK